MKFEHYRERVEESKEFKKFREENKKAYLCAGFFVLDLEQGKNMHQIDFFIPKSKKVATFLLDKGVEMKVSELLSKKKIEELDGKSNTDLDALRGIVTDEMHNRTITQEIKKIIAVLQNEGGKKIWKLNCITGDLGILKVHIDDNTSSVIEFEKANLFDFIKKIPGTLHQPKGVAGQIPTEPAAPGLPTTQIISLPKEEKVTENKKIAESKVEKSQKLDKKRKK